MDIKDSYLHGSNGVVKSIDVDKDKLKYKLADIAGTVREVTLPLATTTDNGLMSSNDKTKLDAFNLGSLKKNLVLKINSGNNEGTSLYTYNGSATKTLDIKNGTGIDFTNNAGSLQIYNSGVISINTGSANGTISVNTNGTSANVAVKGLGSAAYTTSDLYLKQATIVNTNTETIVYKKIVITKNATDGYGIWIHSRQLHYLINSGLAGGSTINNKLWELGTNYNNDTPSTTRRIHIKMVATSSSSTVTLYAAVEGYCYMQIVSSGTITIVDSSKSEYDSITSGTTGWVSCTPAKWTDTTYNVVSSSANGLAPKVINTNTTTIGSAYYVLASTNGSATPSWYKLPANAFANDDTKVTLTNTTASASYRVLFSGNANDTSETTTARKSAKLLFNPSTGILESTYVITSGFKGTAKSLEDLMKSGLALTYNNFIKSSFSDETGITIPGNANGILWVGTHGPEADNTSDIGYGHMLGFVGGGGLLYHKVVTNGDTSGSWKQIAYTTSDITGNAASANKLKTARKLWGLDFDGTADISGNMIGVGDIEISSSNTDRFITFNTGSTRNWRIGYTGSGDGDANYLIFQSTKDASAANGWHDALKFGCETLKATFGGTVVAPTFQGNLDGTYVKLTGYTKATTIGSIATTDSVRTALGKLEYKTDFIYNDLFGTDNDDVINKWHEIVGFIDSVKETETDILDTFVTRKTAQTITGTKTFENDITLYSSTGDSKALIFKRGTATDGVVDWKVFVTNGIFKFLNRSTEDKWDDVINFGTLSAKSISTPYSITASKFIVLNGTSSLFLKADGSIDNTAYLPLTGGTLTGYLYLTTDASSIRTADNKVLLACSGSNNYTGVTDDITTVIGNMEYPTLLRSNNTNLIHYKFNAPYIILDSSNYTSYTPILNSSSTHATNTSVIYAPTTAGTKGYVLQSNGSGAPIWVDLSNLSYGNIKSYRFNGDNSWYTVYHSLSGANGDLILLNLSHAYNHDDTDSLTFFINIGYQKANIVLLNAKTPKMLFKTIRVRYYTDTGGTTNYCIDVKIGPGHAENTFYASGTGKGTFEAYTKYEEVSSHKICVTQDIYSNSFYSNNIIGDEGTFNKQLTINSGYDSKIILNNTDDEGKHQVIAFKAKGTQYGSLGTNNAGILNWNTYPILHTGNYNDYAVSKVGNTIINTSFDLINTTWKDTGYTFVNLSTGTYIIQVTSTNLVASGVMSIYLNMSDTAGDEIPLHVYDTAGWRPYLRTHDNKLLISSNDTTSTSRTVTIKITLIL